MNRRDAGFPATLDITRMGIRSTRPIINRYGKKWIIIKPIVSECQLS
jgi:hypothetical protein